MASFLDGFPGFWRLLEARQHFFSSLLTLGADKGFDAAEFAADLRKACGTPRVARKPGYSAIDVRTRECQEVCVSDRAHAVFRYGQAPKRPANIMAS